MENQNINKFFSLMVVGDNPDELVKKYDASLTVDEYVKYRYDDAGKLKKSSIKMIDSLINNSKFAGISPSMVEYLKERVKSLKKMDDFEYYTALTDGLMYDKDGNALSTENPDGKWKTCQIGKNMCVPLKLKDGTEVFSAKNSDIDWKSMDGNNRNTYECSWKLFHGEIKPITETEKAIYENVKEWDNYFDKFDSMEDYVTYNTSYWCYAYLDKNSGWVDADSVNNFEWISSFMKKFVKKISPDDLVTIYECSKP